MSLLPSLMSPTDAVFLLPESREQPMHVGSLQLFTPPEGAGPDYLTELYERAINETSVLPYFRRRPVRGLTTLGQWAWITDDDIDLEHHIRHSALPRPGRVRELLALTSRLHSTLLDRQRPLWEIHLIEGLADGRFAVYTKTHHAMIDGVSGMRLMERALSTDPTRRDMPLPFVDMPRPPREARDASGGNPIADVARGALSAVSGAVGLGPRLLRIAESGLREQSTALPMQAPRTMLNVSITGSRRFAADGWSLDRIRAVGKAAGATVNDVVVAMCSGALRRYLLEHEALPDSSLVAMTPVSLRTDDDDATGNAVGTILCHLGTDLEDAQERLLAVRASMTQAKENLAGLSQLQVTALSGVVMAPLLLQFLPDVNRFVRPPFNLVISNVPGPKEPLYWNGSRLDGVYPLSIPVQGQALNITVTSYAGMMEFGLIGCRRTVPHLQRLLSGLEEELVALEKAYSL